MMVTVIVVSFWEAAIGPSVQFVAAYVPQLRAVWVQLPLEVGAIAADPRVDLAERLDAEAVVAKAPLGALLDEAGALQDRELLAHGGLRDVDRRDEIGDVALAERERVEERAPRGARDRLKDAPVACVS